MDKKVVILIPSSSRNCDYKGLKNSALVGILYKSLLNYDISKYTFLIGFDDDDSFFISHKKNMEKKFPDNFHLKYLNNYDKNYVCIVNQLAKIAIDEYNADYLFLIADDLIFFDFSFIDKFIDFFTDKEYGLGYGKDKRCRKDICTHPFVPSSHFKSLGYFYPKEIKNWYCDTWITELYSKNALNLTCKTDDYVLENQVLEKRYDVYNIDSKLLYTLVDIAKKIIYDKMQKNNS